MMLLGLVLHTSCNYVTFPIKSIWPYKDAHTSRFADLIVVYIHSFRMPVFMAMAGFFGALLIHKRGLRGFLNNRMARIGVPFAFAYLTILPLARWGWGSRSRACSGGQRSRGLRAFT
jgi:hypothetical protein